MTEKILLEVTPQQIADLRQLVSVAVWIRSEQLGAESTIHTIASAGVDATVPPTQLNKDMLKIETVMTEANEGRWWWGFLTGKLERAGADKLPPSWMQPK